MKLANNVSIRVFIYPEENREGITQAFFSLLGYTQNELEDEGIEFRESTAKGFSNRNIILLSATLVKTRHCNKFLERLSSKLAAVDKQLITHQDNRLDEEYNFFIRLDKEKLLMEMFSVTDSGECFHVKINICAHPRKREVALENIRQIFK